MKGKNIMIKRFGFTLAEVLITLGIIGVVAAMTIPTLMNQTGQLEFKTGIKKAVSVLNQAIIMNIALNSSDLSQAPAGQGAGSVYNMFMSNMNVVKTAAAADATLGTPFAANLGSNYILYFNDGMAVSLSNTAAACVAQTTAGCRMVVDINGTRKPNILSTATNSTSNSGIADEFVLDFYNQQVVPHDLKASYILYQ